MTQVTKNNLDEICDEIERNFKDAVFVSVDCEFSALHLDAKPGNSLFDTPAVRYSKLRGDLDKIIPIQIGLTPFRFDKHDNKYIGTPYQFYIFPYSLTGNKCFVCQSSALYFLSLNNFDFNEFVYGGLPFVNANEHAQLLRAVNNGTFMDMCRASLQNQEYEMVKCNVSIASEWFYSMDNAQELILCDVSQYNPVYLFVFHRELRDRLMYKVWTYVENKKFKVRRVTKEEFKRLVTECTLEMSTFNYLVGFTRVYNILKESKRPVVGHNLYMDIALLINTFDVNIPASYTDFKKLTNKLFPEIYDTKHISFQLKQFIDDSKKYKSNGLDELFGYFSKEVGRHLVSKSPQINTDKIYSSFTFDNFHNAVYDCYCTGYCFIRMAHFLAVKDYKSANHRVMMSREHMSAIAKYKNCINIIRASVSHLCLDGPDPKSERPPCLIIQSCNQKPINIPKLEDLLNQYGSVEIRPYCQRGTRAIAAVANHNSSRRILRQFQNHTEFRVSQYSMLKHSRLFRLVFWCGVLSSGGAFAYVVMTR